MKKEDMEKINTVGQTLGVELSEAKQENKRRMGRILYIIIQGVVTLGSTLLGINLGANTGYPYYLSPWNNFGEGIFFESLIHTGNSLFLIPREMQFGMSRSRRLKIFLGNLVLSVVLFVISFGVNATWDITPSGLRYSVYDNQRRIRSKGF